MVTSNSKRSLPRLGAHLFTLLLIAIGFLSVADAVEIEATLDRREVVAGNGAVLSIKISGRVARPDIPEIPDLVIQPRGTSQQTQVIGRTVTTTSIYTYVVGSYKPGVYEIPSIEVEVKGEKASTKPLRLTVVDSEGDLPAEDEGGEPQEQPQEEPKADDPRNDGFLTVELQESERKHAYVGEIAPVKIQAWIPAYGRPVLRTGIQPEGQGFTLHNLSKRPQESQDYLNGRRYIVITWYGGISATKSGTLPASLSVGATVYVPKEGGGGFARGRRGAFSDPFFNGVFGPDEDLEEKTVTLKSDGQEIEVRALPTEGKPKDFSGAVGNFRFDGVRVPDRWNTGEPEQIAARISGTGNFALVRAPEVTPEETWKTYEGREEFTAGDETSFSGSKVFQFSALPKKGGSQNIALSFSYFDPDAGSYKTLIESEKTVQVTGEDLVEEKESAPVPAPAPVVKSDDLIGQYSSSRPASTLVPISSRAAFLEMLVAAAVMAFAGGVLGWWRLRSSDPRRRAAAQTSRATKLAVDQAAAAGDARGFFAAGRKALQQGLGAKWKQPPHAITSAEVQARLPQDSPVVKWFLEADLCEYGVAAKSEILPEWRKLLADALESLTPTSHA